MSGIDWPGLMRAGLGRPGLGGLGLIPEAFWRLTPIELRIMLGAENALAPLTQSRLEELVAAFPDNRERTSDG